MVFSFSIHFNKFKIQGNFNFKHETKENASDSNCEKIVKDLDRNVMK
jgi:hypothetical protein